MQSLKVLGLVEGMPGPKGGYKATGKAYETLSVDEAEGKVHIPVKRNGELLEGVTVEEMYLRALRNPVTCNSSLRMIGNIRPFKEGDVVEVGPTPVNKLIIDGDVIGRDDSENTLLIEINKLVTLPMMPIGNYVIAKLVFIPPNSSIQEASRILIDSDVKRALVMNRDKIEGILSFKDIGKAVASGKLHTRVKDLVRKEVISIESEESIYEAAKAVDKHNIGSILVTDNGVPKGIVSRADVMKEFAIYSRT
ncbi:MAG: CBS domain protein [Candidatus Syntrophoarchaeum sp. GoM_oil]|nr:MAG: CBS domain protein [Candidatus Syntrophoarchaeum sp. GoM_oil]